MNNTEKNSSYEVNLFGLLDILWKKKIMLISITATFAIGSVLYALSLPNIYTSKTLLAPSEQSESLLSTLGSYTSLVGGMIPFPSGAVNKSQEAVERIKSFDFFEKNILPKIKLQDLMAVERWASDQNTIIYNQKIFDDKNNKWVRKVSLPQLPKPSNQEAFEEFSNLIEIDYDYVTSFVSISVEHQSPIISKQWTDLVIAQINESMREADIRRSQDAITFLNAQAEVTRLNELSEAISQLLESQMEMLMMASISSEYVFRVIESPIAPEKKSSPSRSMICILITLFGGILAILISLIHHFFFSDRNPKNLFK